jgi:hypothetical protein
MKQLDVNWYPSDHIWFDYIEAFRDQIDRIRVNGGGDIYAQDSVHS